MRSREGKYIGLYFGSFNPIHIGHLIVANSMREHLGFDAVWFVISPQNPFKKHLELADESDRYNMVELATKDRDHLEAMDIEFTLPKPSYTIQTLEVLEKEYPEHRFAIIMGKDNLVHFKKWKQYEDVLEKVNLEVYDRDISEDIPEDILQHESIRIHDLPLINVSSTWLRKKVANGESISYWVADQVEEYILEHGIYSAESQESD